MRSDPFFPSTQHVKNVEFFFTFVLDRFFFRLILFNQTQAMTSLHSYKNGGFPPSSKLLTKMWNYENYKKHRKKVTIIFFSQLAVFTAQYYNM